MKMLIRQLVAGLAATLAALVPASAVHAAVADASAADATLDGRPADAFVFKSGWNPHAGRHGNTSGFDTAFAPYGSGAWTLLDKYDHRAGFLNLGQLQFTFSESTTTAGLWSVTNTSATTAITLDLAFAIHAGSPGAAWLFDDATLLPGQTFDGSWQVRWTNRAGDPPDFSTLALFGRDTVLTPVPEPGVWGMLGVGLGVLFLRRREEED
ncbi:PEP-CTERM sorting domain-containing protein [Pseudoduganella chitinolytica]|uniref:PEP-CTERM sorting domain-containing protein n=1 Tax=Pseudoduganella chitinolytica TaxID=34070 RepID=A0ABY8BDQ5_9BURK|nr:PEP-CTERM sorting domain-containing protein [Pseudoduganella chitinolytica]WEF34051.1 PEP-CTERM sorting domain-containing protein [Pseudoduganella chitinolytica]